MKNIKPINFVTFIKLLLAFTVISLQSQIVEVTVGIPGRYVSGFPPLLEFVQLLLIRTFQCSMDFVMKIYEFVGYFTDIILPKYA